MEAQLHISLENTSALPQNSPSQDPAHRFSFNSSLPRSFLSYRTRTGIRSSLHGFGTLGKIPKDLSSFLRTGTLSRHNGKAFQEATAKLGHSGYADSPEPSSRPQSAHLRNMFSTTAGAPEERPTRKLKKENRFYNFLTHSRSRSQSNTDPPPSQNTESNPKVPQKDRAKANPDSKPPYRIPSRPLSSTTTATNTTITPGTPKAKKHPPSSIPLPSTRRQERPENDARRSRPTSPTHSTTNRRKINIFGISITKPRRPSLGSSKSRSRSRSRPGTPRVSVDIPPLPAFGFEEELRTALQPSQSSSRPASPSPSGAKADTTTPLSLGYDPPIQVKDANGDINGSSKIRGFFAGKDSSRSRHQNSSGAPANPVSAPVRRVPSLKRRSLNKALPDRPISPLSDPRPASPNSNLNSNIPQIVNTPATSVRAATVSGGTMKSAAASTSKAGFGFRNRSLDTGYRYRGTMDVVDEEGRLSRESKELKGSAIPRLNLKGKEKESSEGPAQRTSLSSRMSASVRNTKHGSFDFERPGLGALAMQRTTSNGTSTTVTSGWSRSNDTHAVRESTLGPGLAGVGTLQRDVSVKRGQEREEKAKGIKKQAKEAGVKTIMVVEDPEPTPKTNPSPAHSSNGHQTPPSGTTSGKSSSLSKASGRRFFGRKSLSSRNTTQHGLFSFEPPVPSPTWSTASAGTTKEVAASWGGRTEKEKGGPRRDKDRLKPLEKRPSQRRDRSPVPVPLPNAGHRSGVKGRSLDLNIGLAWAPSKVREDALLPSSSLFNRSISNSSDTRSANSSNHGHDSRSDETTSEKMKIGRETAELFRKTLGEARYMRFKTYIYQFDAHEIPFDGPTGIISKVDALLATVPTLGLDEKRRLMDKLVRIILQNA